MVKVRCILAFLLVYPAQTCCLYPDVMHHAQAIHWLSLLRGFKRPKTR